MTLAGQTFFLGVTELKMSVSLVLKFNRQGDILHWAFRDFLNALFSGRKSVAKLLGNLLLIQESLLEQNADTSNILNPGTDNKTTARSSDDEEIPSDTEDETSDGGVDNGEGHVNKEQAKHSLKLPAKRKHDMVG